MQVWVVERKQIKNRINLYWKPIATFLTRKEAREYRKNKTNPITTRVSKYCSGEMSDYYISFTL